MAICTTLLRDLPSIVFLKLELPIKYFVSGGDLTRQNIEN